MIAERGTASAESSGRAPSRAPAWAAVACAVAAVGIPAATGLASASGRFAWLWSWGTPPPGRMASGLGLAAAAALALVLLARASGRWRDRDGRGWRVARAVGFALVVSGVGSLLLRWPVASSSLDANIWVSEADSPFIMGSAPLGHWSHTLFHRLGRALSFGSWIAVDLRPKERAVVLASVAAGTFVVGALLLLGRGAFPRSSRWSSVAFLFVTPTLVFYAGFREVTPWCYAFVTVYLLAGLRFLARDPSRPPWFESLILMLALWTHGSACFVAGAHAFLCLHWFLRAPHEATGPWQPARVARLIVLAAVPFLALAATLAWAWAFGTGSERFAWYGHALGGPDGLLFVAPTRASQQDGSHVVFASRVWWQGQLNLLLFACPLLVLVPAAIARGLRARRPQTLFLTAGLAGLLLLAWTFNPHARGGYRGDLDVVAFFALPATLLVALWWDEHFGDRQREVLSLASAVSVFGFLLMLRLRFP